MRKTLHRIALLGAVPALILTLTFTGCSLPHLRTGQAGNGVRFVIQRPSATSIAVVGDFNRWSTERDLLSGPDGNGYWSTTLDLPPGRYEYLFLVDGTDWVPDPAAVSADDGMGGTNSVLIVGEHIP